MTKRVLFLCTGNSARSQLAEALFNSMCGDDFIAISAGVDPLEIDPRVFVELTQRQLSGDGLRSKDFSEVAELAVDFVITLCDNAKGECVLFEQHINQLHWNLEDPRPLAGQQPFTAVANQLVERISLFLLLNSGETQQYREPTLLFKLMSDPLRLKLLMLLEDEQELTVTELTQALQQSQPKVSRHLKVLRDCTLLQDRRYGQWIRYRLSPTLPKWILHVLRAVRLGNPGIINQEKRALKSANES